jgi:phosphoribosylanthranilate isomerase
MFRTKICGITNGPDARLAVAAGADALGFNFYRHSKRFVELDLAQQITSQLPLEVMKVGVFVNHAPDEISRTVDHLHLDCVQLHGDEPPKFLIQIPQGVAILRAFRCGNDGLVQAVEYLNECRALGRAPDAVLLDADAGTAYGGSGQPADWDRIAADRKLLGSMPLILAGGLSPDNVAIAVSVVRPEGVDVASGVETLPGRKDPELVRRFITAASAALMEAHA